MTRVLLFGAAGFLGSAVRRRLAADATVSCPGRAQCDLVTATVADLVTLLQNDRPDVVVNCTGRIAGSNHDLVGSNTAVTAKLIDAVAVAAPEAVLVRLGSAAEYGVLATGRRVREADVALPTGAYGVSHLAATRLVELATAAGLVRGVVLRVFNPIGAGAPGTNVLGAAAARIRSAQAAGAAHIALGPLDAYRDFVDARDVAEAVAAVASSAGGPPDVTYNIASGQSVPVREAVRVLAEVAGFTGEIREDAQAPDRAPAVGWMCADIDRAAAGLGWAPTRTLAESVAGVWHGVADRQYVGTSGPTGR